MLIAHLFYFIEYLLKQDGVYNFKEKGLFKCFIMIQNDPLLISKIQQISQPRRSHLSF